MSAVPTSAEVRMQHLRTKLDALLLDELEERADELVGSKRA